MLLVDGWRVGLGAEEAEELEVDGPDSSDKDV